MVLPLEQYWSYINLMIQVSIAKHMISVGVVVSGAILKVALVIHILVRLSRRYKEFLLNGAR
jgi:hypothetical protein